MARNPQPRSSLPSVRAVQPEFGARHPIAYTDDIDLFFSEVFIVLDEIIPQGVNVDNHAKVKNKHQFRVYDDPKRVGVSVLERRLTRSYAQRQRVKWTRNDIGRIKGEIQNEIDRLGIDSSSLTGTFTNVVRLGDAEAGPNARKLGLILDQESPISELLVSEHEIVVDGISGSLKRFKYPYDTFVPHWTLARIARVPEGKHGDEIHRAVAAIQHLMPITVQLEPINLYAHQSLDLS